MQKPYKLTQLKDAKDIEQLDNLLTILFNRSQGNEFRFLEFTGAGIWASADMISEKELVICKNKTDNIVRIYTKIAGTLQYLQFS